MVRFVFFLVGLSCAAGGFSQEPSQLSSCRVRLGGVCGSGGIIAHDGDESLVLSNAHVVGTRVGRQVSTEWWNADGSSFTIPGRVSIAAYNTATSTDWAIVRVKDARVRIRQAFGLGSGAGSELTTGAPRCEWLSTRILRPVSDGPVRRALPAAIGGQSGSITVRECSTVGLVTWTDGTHTLMQSASKIAGQYNAQSVAQGPPIESGWVPVGDVTPCETGFYAEVSALGVDVSSTGCSSPGPVPEGDLEKETDESRLERLIRLVIQVYQVLKQLGLVSDRS